MEGANRSSAQGARTDVTQAAKEEKCGGCPSLGTELGEWAQDQNFFANYMQKRLCLVHIFVKILHLFVVL